MDVRECAVHLGSLCQGALRNSGGTKEEYVRRLGVRGLDVGVFDLIKDGKSDQVDRRILTLMFGSMNISSEDRPAVREMIRKVTPQGHQRARVSSAQQSAMA